MSYEVVPWILISQSARAGRARALRDAIQTTLMAQRNNEGGPRYRVLLDETDIQPGEAWRSTNDEWLWRCDGAVLMLNNAALREESYVVHEVTIMWLRWQKSRDHFRFVIVRFPDVDDDLLERRLKPFQFPEIQQIRLPDAFRDDSEQAPSEEVDREIQTVTAKIVSAMDKLGRDRSGDWFEEQLVDMLNHQTRDLDQLHELRGLLDRQGDTRTLPKPAVCRWIIRRLLGSDGSIGTERLDQLRVAVDQLMTIFPSLDHLRRVINYIMPYCWVHPEAAARLCRIACRPDGLRAVAWRRNWDLSEKMYLWRAWSRPLTRIVAVHVKSGDLEDCKTRVHEALALKFNRDPATTPATEVRRRIQKLAAERGEPVCVVLAASQTGYDIITVLTQEWPEVLFFLFERDTDRAPLAAWELTGIEWLTPAIDLSLEADALDHWSDMMSRAEVDENDITTGRAFA